MRKLSTFWHRAFAELKRRRVARAAALYAAVAFAVWQVADVALPALHVPDWSMTLVVLLAVLGFPLAMVVAWMFDFTPHGLERTPGPVVGVADAPAVEKTRWSVTDAGAPLPASEVALLEGRPAIAVLPFENRSSDPDQEYFADGIAEDLITRLSAWRSYPVIARHASFSLKGRALGVKEIGATLGARYIVQGSVRRSGARLRIGACLIDAANARQVWAHTYDSDVTDLFDVQDEIGEAIAAPLMVDLQRAELARASRRLPDSLDAWEMYHRARSVMSTFTHENMTEARALLNRAVASDPHFAPAWSALAEAGMNDVMGGWCEHPDRVLDEALAHARRGVELEPTDAEAHNSLSMVLMMVGDSFGAQEASRRALELNPSLPRALTLNAYHRQIAGQPPEESIEQVKRAMQLSPHDPFEWLYYDVLASSYFNAGRFREGLEAGQRLITVAPTYYWGYLYSAMNSVGLGRLDDARAFVRHGHAIKPDLSFELARSCLGTMAPDVERRFLAALRAAGLD